jgi:lipopolysaccharide export LptBFGC system permease protein LptF
MLGIPLWEMMFGRRLFTQAVACFTVLATLFVLLDFGLQASTLLKEIGLKGIPLHYLLVLSKRLPLLVALSTVLSGVGVAFQSIKTREWLALLVGGISAYSLLRPFFLMGIMASLLLLANSQWLQPHAVDRLDALEGQHSLRVLALSEGGHLICRSARGPLLQDPFWVTADTVVTARQIDLLSGKAEALLAVHRTKNGWERDDTVAAAVIATTPKRIRWQFAPWAESQRLSHLFTLSLQPGASSKVIAVALQRISLSLLPLLSLVVALPGVLLYRRTASWMPSLLLGLAIVLIGATVIEGASVLTSLGVLSPLAGFGIPLGGILLLAGLRWQRWHS